MKEFVNLYIEINVLHQLNISNSYNNCTLNEYEKKSHIPNCRHSMRILYMRIKKY